MSKPMGKNARKHARRRKWYKDMQEQPCHYCGTSPGGTVDHMKPLSKGGTPLPSNSVPSCERCNIRKGSMDYEEFITVDLDYLLKKNAPNPSG